MNYYVKTANGKEAYKIFPVKILDNEIKLIVKDDKIYISVCSLAQISRYIPEKVMDVLEDKEHIDLFDTELVNEICTPSTFLILKKLREVYLINITYIEEYIEDMLDGEEYCSLMKATSKIKDIINGGERSLSCKGYPSDRGVYRITFDIHINNTTHSCCDGILCVNKFAYKVWHISGALSYYNYMDSVDTGNIVAIKDWYFIHNPSRE